MKEKFVILDTNSEECRKWYIGIIIAKNGSLRNRGKIVLPSDSIKTFALLSDNEGGDYWSVRMQVNTTGSFKNKGVFWTQSHEEQEEHNKKYAGSDIVKRAYGKYNLSISGKVRNKKMRAKRKGFGYQEYNKPFNECAAHHVDTTHIIYIPGDIHKSINHNLHTGQNMDRINALAFEYLFRQV